MGMETRWAGRLVPLATWRKFPAHSSGKGDAQSEPGLEGPIPGVLQSQGRVLRTTRQTKKPHGEETAELCRGSPSRIRLVDYCWSVCTCEDSTWDQDKKHRKELKGTVLGAQTEQGIMPVPDSQSNKHSLEAIGESPEKGLAQERKRLIP